MAATEQKSRVRSVERAVAGTRALQQKNALQLEKSSCGGKDCPSDTDGGLAAVLLIEIKV